MEVFGEIHACIPTLCVEMREGVAWRSHMARIVDDANIILSTSFTISNASILSRLPPPHFWDKEERKVALNTKILIGSLKKENIQSYKLIEEFCSNIMKNLLVIHSLIFHETWGGCSRAICCSDPWCQRSIQCMCSEPCLPTYILP